MTFDPTVTARYTIDDVRMSWPDEAEGTHIGYIADEEEGVPFGLAYVRFRKGVTFEFAWPYDEVCVVTKGSLTVRSGGRRVTARAGEIMTQPRGVPGVFEIDEDMEMICVHFPTFAIANGMTLREYQAHSETSEDPTPPAPQPRAPQTESDFFDPSAMQRFAVSDMPSWIVVDADQGAWVGYIADQAEGFPVGLAFSDFRAGGVYELEFPYDEVAAITKGGFTVHSQGRSFTVGTGELLYMPAGVSATFEIDEDTIAVGVHYPTLAEATGSPPQ